MKVKLADEQELRRELIKVKTKMKKILSEKFEGAGSCGCCGRYEKRNGYS